MNVTPARLITPTTVYRKANVEVRDDALIVRNIRGRELARYPIDAQEPRVLAVDGQPVFIARWALDVDGETWLVEHMDACNCGGTVTAAPTDDELGLLAGATP